MEIISAILAFALLMVAFSTIASGLNELLLRLLELRAGTLRFTVAKFLDDVIDRNLKDARSGGGAGLSGTERTDLLDALTRNLVGEGKRAGRIGGFLNWLQRFMRTDSLDRLSTEAFLERLAKTEIGVEFLKEAEAIRQKRIADLSLSFDRYMAMASETYRKNANTLAVVVAIVLAIAGNIDFGRLVGHLRENPEIVEAIIEQQEDIVAKVATATPGAIGDEDGGRAPGARVQDADGQQGGAPQTEALQAQTKALAGEFAMLREDYSLPIGWSYWPNSGEAGTNWWMTWGLWLVNVLLSGFLIGLGAPFWYRVVQSVGQIRGIGQALGLEERETVAETRTVNDKSRLERAAEHVKLFEAAAGHIRRSDDPKATEEQ